MYEVRSGSFFMALWAKNYAEAVKKALKLSIQEPKAKTLGEVVEVKRARKLKDTSRYSLTVPLLRSLGLLANAPQA